MKREDVEHLFTEGWHHGYFLKCRVDFAVCDPHGVPEFVVEFQGSYHGGARQAGRDAFKRAVIEAVGVPLHELTAKEIEDFDA